jgi:hypothetical protein
VDADLLFLTQDEVLMFTRKAGREVPADSDRR